VSKVWQTVDREDCRALRLECRGGEMPLETIQVLFTPPREISCRTGNLELHLFLTDGVVAETP